MADKTEVSSQSAAEPDHPALTGWQKAVYIGIVILAGGAAVGAAMMVIRELGVSPSLSKPVVFAYRLTLISWAAFFVAAVWFACIVQFTSPNEARLRHRRAAWRHVGYQIAVFLILALSLRAFVLPHDEPKAPPASHSKDTAAGVPAGTQEQSAEKTKHIMLTASELAAIMILFALAELAALLGKDVAQATDEIENVKREANLARRSMEAVRESLEISRTEIEKSEAAIQKAIGNLELMQVPQAVEKMHTDVKSGVLKLLEAWSKRASHHDASADDLQHLAWRVFLREYVLEEASDFAPKKLQTEGVPIAAQPYPTVEQVDGSLFNVDGASISYVATNVGFYAKFLDRLVTEMVLTANGQYISLAVLTTVLPAYWWNWPRSTGRHLAYAPIEALRKTMAEMPDRVRSDRLILVRAKGATASDDPSQISTAVENALEDEALLDKMESWWVASAETGDDLLPCSTKNSKNDEFMSLAKKMPDRLRESVIQNGGLIHPVFEERIDGPVNMDDRLWTLRPLVDAFKALHQGDGRAWALPVSNDYIINDLDGRYDFTFIGISDREVTGKLGAWSDESIQWKFCIMTSSSDKNETMFMTLVDGEAAAMQMRECRARLKDEMGRARPIAQRDPPTAPDHVTTPPGPILQVDPASQGAPAPAIPKLVE